VTVTNNTSQKETRDGIPTEKDDNNPRLYKDKKIITEAVSLPWPAPISNNTFYALFVFM
jgi:hypothetical protein